MSEAPRSIGPSAVCAAVAATFVALGGAFLVGVMVLVAPGVFAHPAAPAAPPANIEAAERLEVFLYMASSGCFVVGIAALMLAYRKLP